MKFGKLPTLPWYVRLVAFLMLAGLAYGGFYYFITSGTRTETKAMNDEIARLRPLNAQAQIVSQNLNNFKALYKAREEEFAELKALLPEQRELTMVLQGIQERARGNGLILTKFSPKEDLQQDNYSGKKIEVSVTVASPDCGRSSNNLLTINASFRSRILNLSSWKNSRPTRRSTPVLI